MSFEGSGRFTGLSFWPSGSILGAAIAIELGLIPLDTPPVVAGLLHTYTIRGLPGRGSIRGGEYVLVSTGIDLSGTTYDLLSGSVLTSWASSGTVTTRLAGLELVETASAGPTGSIAQARVEADFVVEAPRSVAPATSVELAAITLTLGARVLRVALRLDAVRGYLALIDDNGVQMSAIPVAVTPSSEGLIGSLGLTFYGGALWAYINGELFGVRLGLGTSAGTVRVATAGAGVRTRFTALRVLGQALINTRPLETPTIQGTTQIDGLTPTAEVVEAGPADVIAFSPAGVALGDDAFIYTSAPRKVLLRGETQFRPDVIIYDRDLQVRDP